MADQATPSPRDEPQESAEPLTPEKPRRRHPAFGLMKGETTIAPGVDLTAPAFPEWADLIDEKYGQSPLHEPLKP